jgi:hypothetical protein
MDTSDQIRVWEKIIDVQKHFNEVKSKNQTLFISVITASIAASGYLSQGDRGSHLSIFMLHIQGYTLPLLAAIIFTIAFYILDVEIYHVLLKGAVRCGKDFENNILHQKLTSNIIEEQSESDTFIFPFIKGAHRKLIAFYVLIGGVLLLLFLILNCCNRA